MPVLKYRNPVTGKYEPVVGPDWKTRIEELGLEVAAGAHIDSYASDDNWIGNYNLDMNGRVLNGPADPDSGGDVGDRDYNDARYQMDDSTGAQIRHSSYALISATWNVATFNVTDYNNRCTIASNRVYVPDNGWYACHYSGYLETAYPGTLGAMRIYKNGAIEVEVHENLGSYNAGFWMEANDLIWCTAGQYISAGVYENIRTMYWYNNVLTVVRVS